MRTLPQDEASKLVAEMPNTAHLATNALDIHTGIHPTEGKVAVILSILGDAVVIKLDKAD